MGDRLMADKPAVFLGIPTRGGWGACGAARGYYVYPGTRAGYRIGRAEATSSILTNAFNQLWAEALNARETHGVTRFAMIHDDVCPEQGWLVTLLGELDRLGADVVSAVIAIKDNRGLTSTALDTPGDPWHPRRLTLTEVMELPETFSAEDCGHIGALLVNTGLWVADLTRPWCKNVCFKTLDRLDRRGNKYVAEVQSEDWVFSRKLHKLVYPRVFATRKVYVEHKGDMYYPNNVAGGRWKTDEAFKELVPEAAAT